LFESVLGSHEKNPQTSLGLAKDEGIDYSEAIERNLLKNNPYPCHFGKDMGK
jgi:hypothetical protein